MSFASKALLLTMSAFATVACASVDSISQPQSTVAAFTQNQGQWPDSILFRSDAGGTVMWFTRDGIYYQFTHRVERSDQGCNPSGFHDPLVPGPYRIDTPPDSIETMLVKAVFVGSNPMAEVSGEGLLGYRCNYFLGSDPTGWRSDIPNYGGIVYEGIYPGIDLRLYGEGHGQIAYVFATTPGADLSQIKVIYQGNVETAVDGEGLPIVTTMWGATLEAMASPAAFTGIASPRPVADPEGRSAVEAGDPGSSGRQSMETTLDYSTYLGGSSYDRGHGVAVDGSGCAYVTGTTYSPGFPTQNPYDASSNGGWDVFVTKFSALGNSLIYSTFLGGSGTDSGMAVAVGVDGCAYVTGNTISSNFPTQNAYDASSNGVWDVFVTRLSAAGNALVYSTFLGSSSGDYGHDIAVDSSGCAYVTGHTESTNFPTANAYDDSYNLGWYDGFVTKFSAAGNSLVYSTFLGGSGYDLGYGIALGHDGSAYVTGGTNSTDFPVQNPYDASPNGDFDAFVTKFTPAGNSLVYSTFLGGSGYDGSNGVVVDGSGCAYVTGQTTSTDFPTQNAYDATYNLGGYDAFVTKFSTAGNALAYSTYLGGKGAEYGYGIAADASGRAIVAGSTESSDFPTQSPYDPSYNGAYDAFVTELSAAGKWLVYSTFLGGSDWDQASAVAVDDSGRAYVTGATLSPNFPTRNSYDPSHNGLDDVFVTKLAGATSCCLIRGDIDHDGMGPNVADLVYLVTYMFGDGPEPPCVDESDIDGSGVGPDIADLVYLVTYMFGGGPVPVPCS